MRCLYVVLFAFLLAVPAHAEEITGTLITGQGSKPATTTLSSNPSNTGVVSGGGSSGYTAQTSNVRAQVQIDAVAQEASAANVADNQTGAIPEPIATVDTVVSKKGASEPSAAISREGAASADTQLAGTPASVSDNPENLAAADTAVPGNTFDFLWPFAVAAALAFGGLAGFLVGKRRD